MKRLSIALLALATGSWGPAFAADLPAKAVTPAPAYVPSTDPFTGMYIGINGGYGFDNGSAEAFSVIPLGTLKTAPQGVFGGIQGGYGGRFANIWYAGLEGDLDIANLTGDANIPGLITATSKNTWMGSIRGRLGVIPVGHAMIYGTAGYAFGGANVTVTDFLAHTASLTPTVTGFVWGGGLEVPFGPNWTGRLEYLQYDFGTLTAATSAAVFTTKDRVDAVRAGLSYRF